MSLFQPSNQIKLTNVSVIRLKKAGKRFEIACYKNKVMEYRNGVESDLDNVLQSASIFTNVSKGQVASQNDIEEAFKTNDNRKVLMEILKKGEVQISTLERNSQISSMQRDIIQIISSKTVNPETKRPYPASIIEKSLGEIHFNVKTSKSAKQQALECIKILQSEKIIPISRAEMKILINLAPKDYKRLKEKMSTIVSSFISEDYSDSECQVECLIEPGEFRTLTELFQSETRGQARCDVLSLNEVAEGDEKF